VPVTDDDRIAELLADLAVRVEFPVAWADMDAMGHVNNTVYLRYFETARITCFAELWPESIEQSEGWVRSCTRRAAASGSR
jgi:acyl-CoA thioester hydrolase